MILLMGIAGSGKGTQGKMLADTKKLHLVSMGDVVRMYVTGKQRERMLAGELLADKEIIAIVDQVLSSLADHEDVILDGFPRTVPQAEWLVEQCRAGRFDINAIFHLVASRQAVKERLLKRGRLDDVDEAINARFDEYAHSTMPVLKWLEDQGLDVVNVDAERPVEAVNGDLINYLDSKSSK